MIDILTSAERHILIAPRIVFGASLCHSPELVRLDVLHLEALPVGPDEVLEEVVEHGGDAVDHGGVREDGADLGAQPIEHLDGLLTHDVVVARQAAHVVVLALRLSPLLRRQPRPLLPLQDN